MHTLNILMTGLAKLTPTQITACFLSAATHMGADQNQLCHADVETGISYIMSTPVKWGKCEMVQFALTANTVVFFLCFLASITLVKSTIEGMVEREADGGSLRDTESFGQVEVVQVLAEK